MTACPTCIFFFTVVGAIQIADDAQAPQEYWDRIRAMANEGTPQGNPKLLDYLRSLEAQEMLTAAREACRDATERFGSDGERMIASSANVGLCVPYFFDRVGDTQQGVTELLTIIQDRKESAWLRHAFIEASRGNGTPPFAKIFQTYTESHYGDIIPVFTDIVKDEDEHAYVRQAAVAAIATLLEGQFKAICSKDPNVRAVKEKSHKIVPVGKLVRSGEIRLTKETWETLKPLETHVLANAHILGGILADEVNEPAIVRGRAEAMLEVYQRLPLTDAAQREFDKILPHEHE